MKYLRHLSYCSIFLFSSFLAFRTLKVYEAIPQNRTEITFIHEPVISSEWIILDTKVLDREIEKIGILIFENDLLSRKTRDTLVRFVAASDMATSPWYALWLWTSNNKAQSKILRQIIHGDKNILIDIQVWASITDAKNGINIFDLESNLKQQNAIEILKIINQLHMIDDISRHLRMNFNLRNAIRSSTNATGFLDSRGYMLICNQDHTQRAHNVPIHHNTQIVPLSNANKSCTSLHTIDVIRQIKVSSSVMQSLYATIWSAEVDKISHTVDVILGKSVFMHLEERVINTTRERLELREHIAQSTSQMFQLAQRSYAEVFFDSGIYAIQYTLNATELIIENIAHSSGSIVNSFLHAAFGAIGIPLWLVSFLIIFFTSVYATAFLLNKK